MTRTFSQARFINHANQTQTEKNKENQLELKMVRQAEKEQKEELLQVCHIKLGSKNFSCERGFERLILLVPFLNT